MKVLRKQYSIVYDILSKSGFGWNDIKKCVEVDSEEIWQSYVQHHKEAEGWKGRVFPLYEKLMNIYGTDRANGQRAKTPADMVEDINRNHVIDDMGDEEEFLNQTSSTNSTSSSRQKRKKPSDNISEGLGKLAESFDKMMEKSNEQVEKIVEVIVESTRKKEHDQHNFMWEELTRLEIPVEVCVDAFDIIVTKPWTEWARHDRLTSIVPSTASAVGEAAIAMHLGEGATEEDGELIANLFGAVGKVWIMDEKLSDAAGAVGGTGIAFAFVAIEAMADGGVAAGLPREAALGLAAQAFYGAAAMVMKTGKHPGQLKDQVASPGGITIAGIHELEKGAFRASMMNAIISATKRSHELGR